MPDTDAVAQEQSRSHVLVADDEAIAAMALERFLTRKGYRVTTACDGREALAIHREDPADIVVTDMRMPRGGGHELIGNLRSTDDLLPIVVMTGYMSPNEEEAIPAGDRLVVMQKPIEVERLLEIIRSFTG